MITNPEEALSIVNGFNHQINPKYEKDDFYAVLNEMLEKLLTKNGDFMDIHTKNKEHNDSKIKEALLGLEKKYSFSSKTPSLGPIMEDRIPLKQKHKLRKEKSPGYNIIDRKPTLRTSTHLSPTTVSSDTIAAPIPTPSKNDVRSVEIDLDLELSQR